MRILSWNCRGLGGPSTISQLNKATRLHLPDLAFVCETKQRKGFIAIVCKRLKYKERWDVVEPDRRKGEC